MPTYTRIYSRNQEQKCSHDLYLFRTGMSSPVNHDYFRGLTPSPFREQCVHESYTCCAAAYHQVVAVQLAHFSSGLQAHYSALPVLFFLRKTQNLGAVAVDCSGSYDTCADSAKLARIGVEVKVKGAVKNVTKSYLSWISLGFWPYAILRKYSCPIVLDLILNKNSF